MTVKDSLAFMQNAFKSVTHDEKSTNYTEIIWQQHENSAVEALIYLTASIHDASLYIAEIVGGLHREDGWNDDRQTHACVTKLIVVMERQHNNF